MVTATFNGQVIAQSDDTVKVEGNHYFPRSDANMDLLSSTPKEYTCPWKGEATYYSVHVGSEEAKNAVWSYEDPKPAARNIKGYLAFDTRFITVE